VIAPEDAARLGIVETFRPGDHGKVEAVAARLAALGIRHLRTEVSWAEYEADSGAAWYDWLLRRLGDEFAVLPCVHVASSMLTQADAPKADPNPPHGVADFVATIIDRHGAAFDAIELGTTPPSPLHRDKPHDVDNLFEMIEAAVVMARRRDKQVVLGIGTDQSWLRQLGERGVLRAVDIIGVHAFPGSWPTTRADAWPGLLDSLATAAALFNPDLKFWITETGYSTSGFDFAGQMEAMAEAADAPVDRLYWSCLQDTAGVSPRSTARSQGLSDSHFGLHDASGQPKPLGRLLGMGLGEVRRTVSVIKRPRTPAIVGTKPVLVTGGAGFIGANLVDRLAAEGHDVLVYDALARPGVERNLHWLAHRHPSRVSFAIGDMRDGEALAEAAANATAIFHLAGQVAVTTSLVEPLEDFAINAQGTLRLLDTLRVRNPAAPLIFASTNKVYGDLADITLAPSNSRYLPLDQALLRHGVGETRPLCFHTPYGCSKGAADQYVLDYAHSFGLRTAVLRMSCIYGERQLGTEDQGWVAHFLLRAIAGDSVTIYGDGMQVRDVLHVGDAVSAYLSAWDQIGTISGRAYNLGGGPGNAISLLQLIDHIGDLLGRRVDLQFAEWRPGDQRYFVADTRAVRRDLALAAPLGWRIGVARLAEWFGAETRQEGPRHGQSAQRVASV
jgi:CDP-paratose 2-epimerase